MITDKKIPHLITKSALTGFFLVFISKPCISKGEPVSTDQTIPASTWQASGELELQNRFFFHDGLLLSQENHFISLGLVPELTWISQNQKKTFTVKLFSRLETPDSARTHSDIREAYFSFYSDRWDVQLGIMKTFWGVTESRHLVDVINQTDLLEDIDQEDKLGQPLLNFNYTTDWGRLELYCLPLFRETRFPDSAARFQLQLPVDEQAVLYESSHKTHSMDYAIRYSHYLGAFDWGVYYFNGTSREPRLLLSPEADSFIPVYDQMQQAGLDAQMTLGAWLWKLEFIRRNTQIEDFSAALFGFEYTFFQVFNTPGNLGLLAEYQYDDRSQLMPTVASDDDVFLGLRLTLNDANDTTLLSAFTWDVNTQSRFFNVEFESRLGRHNRLKLTARAFSKVEPNDAYFFLRQDDYIELSFIKHF